MSRNSNDQREGFDLLPKLSYDVPRLKTGAYLVVRIEEDGRLLLQGTREEIESFLEACAEAGFVVGVGGISWCG